MLFHPQAVEGVRLIETQPVGDERGYFARIYCAEELRGIGVEFRIEQARVAF